MNPPPTFMVVEPPQEDLSALHEADKEIAELFGEDPMATQETVVARAKAYLTCRRLKEEAEALAKQQGAQLAIAEEELVRAMNGADVKSIKLDHEGQRASISQTSTVYYSLPPGALDDADIFAWLEKNGGHDLVKRSIHHATFSSLCKELCEQGKPADVLHPAVKIVEKRGVMLRRS